jgi:hypothetical protein
LAWEELLGGLLGRAGYERNQTDKQDFGECLTQFSDLVVGFTGLR